jgi:hypothetical protein
MDFILRTLAILVCLPWLVDAGMRRLLASAARQTPQSEAEPPTTRVRWLVVVPARSEGEAVIGTLESVRRAASDHDVHTVVLLDGADPEAEAAAERLVHEILIKEPAGPTKGTALRWLVENRDDLLDTHDAVIVLDVGSSLDPGFFSHVGWTGDSTAVQAWLRGSDGGVGEAASLSESAAQRWQDRGRQALGWTVQLRGTGMVLAPWLLRRLAPRLWTSVEDTEATLLLAADRVPVVLAADQAIVSDTKPSAITDAAMQRSRWLFGKISLFYHQPAALLKLCLRSPAEGLAFLCELLSRPYTLTGLLRAALAAACPSSSRS